MKLDPSQVDLHRFLVSGDIFRFLSLVFGETSSPFCAMAVCKLHADRMEGKLPLACEVVKNKLYIDDPVTGCDDLPTGISTIEQLLEFFESIHMELHKLASNSEDLLAHFKGRITILESDKSDILGIAWNTLLDVLTIKPTPTEVPQTKREVLSLISKVYHPLGTQSPLTCRGKLIMQSLWKDKCEWDQPVPVKLQSEVNQWVEASKVNLPVPC